jgi:hypothetical protein
MKTPPIRQRPTIALRLPHLLSLGGAAFLLAAAAFPPASLLPLFAGFSERGIVYERIEGSLWTGEAQNVYVRGFSLGNVRYRLRPDMLMRAALGAEFDLRGGAVRGEGIASVNAFGGAGVERAKLAVNLGAMRGYSILGEPLGGEANAKIERLWVSRSGCHKAQGEVWTDALSSAAKRYGDEGLELVGRAQCAERDLVVALAGRGTNGEVEVRLSIGSDFSYSVVAAVQPYHDDIGEALAFLGFHDENGIMSFAARGSISGPQS